MSEKRGKNYLKDATFDNDDIRRLTNLEKLYDKAYALALELFEHKKDKSNKPYVNHLIRVSDNLDTTEEKIVALLHDTLEDTYITKEDLKELGFPDFIIESVELLTKPDSMTYKEYIHRITKSKNKVALKVKLSDLKDNRDESRLKQLNPLTATRLRKKYDKVIPKVRRAIKKIEDK